MMRIYKTGLLIGAVALLSGCAEVQTKFDDYMSTMPKAYGDTRPLVKPPAEDTSHLIGAEETSIADSAPAMPVASATPVQAVPLAPSAPPPPAIEPAASATTPAAAWADEAVAMTDDSGPVPLSPAVSTINTPSPVVRHWVSPAPAATGNDAWGGDLSPVTAVPYYAPSYAPSPMPSLHMPQERIVLIPPAGVTREVDYGRSITIYPLDNADAPMPYIPPSRNYRYDSRQAPRTSGFVPPGLNP